VKPQKPKLLRGIKCVITGINSSQEIQAISLKRLGRTHLLRGRRNRTSKQINLYIVTKAAEKLQG